jgi:hypothetical protein
VNARRQRVHAAWCDAADALRTEALAASALRAWTAAAAARRQRRAALFARAAQVRLAALEAGFRGWRRRAAESKAVHEREVLAAVFRNWKAGALRLRALRIAQRKILGALKHRG